MIKIEIEKEKYQELLKYKTLVEDGNLLDYKSLVENSFLDKILIVEGIGDKFYIEKAWEKLRPGRERKFKIIAGGGSESVRVLLKGFSSEGLQQTVIGLFDIDSGGYPQRNSLPMKEVNGTPAEWQQPTEEDKNPSKGLLKRHRDGNVFALMLPVPVDMDEDIRKQVIKNNSSDDGGTGTVSPDRNHGTYGEYSEFEIESLFYGKISQEDFFKSEPKYPNSNVILPIPNKKRIEDYIDKNFFDMDKTDFDFFEPLITRIEELFKFS